MLILSDQALISTSTINAARRTSESIWVRCVIIWDRLLKPTDTRPPSTSMKNSTFSDASLTLNLSEIVCIQVYLWYAWILRQSTKWMIKSLIKVWSLQDPRVLPIWLRLMTCYLSSMYVHLSSIYTWAHADHQLNNIVSYIVYTICQTNG